MVTEELLAYIKRQQANHVPEESIRAILLSNGWLKVDVDKAFDSLFKVQESTIVTAKDLKSKIATFVPDVKKTAVDFGTVSQPQVSLGVATATSPLVNDQYREPINDIPKEQFTSQSMGSSLGKELPDDLKQRLQKISSGSIFAPQRETINPVAPSVHAEPNPLLNMNPIQKTGQTFEERLMSQDHTQGTSQFPIKRETIMAQPTSSLHMIEDKPLLAPEGDQNRLYSNFKGGSPYSPSMDKFNSPTSGVVQKKGIGGKIVFTIIFLGIIAGGYYLFTQKPDMIRSLIDTLTTRFSPAQEQMVIVDTENSTQSNTETTEQNPIVNENTQPAPVKEEPSTLPNTESTLKSIALKIPAYVGAKSTTKGVCSNITSGIAKDIISLKQTYGPTVSCSDDTSGFALTVPYQTTGEFMCIDATQEIVLIKAIPKGARCM